MSADWQAIIGAVGDLDGVLSPDQKGSAAMRSVAATRARTRTHRHTHPHTLLLCCGERSIHSTATGRSGLKPAEPDGADRTHAWPCRLGLRAGRVIAGGPVPPWREQCLRRSVKARRDSPSHGCVSSAILSSTHRTSSPTTLAGPAAASYCSSSGRGCAATTAGSTSAARRPRSASAGATRYDRRVRLCLSQPHRTDRRGCAVSWSAAASPALVGSQLAI